jgi:hypothetical protein
MYNGVNWEDNGEEKKNQWGGKTKVNEADLPIYHVDLRFFQINLNVKQREIYIYIFDLVNYSEL